jgi:hypothetical protein
MKTITAIFSRQLKNSKSGYGTKGQHGSNGNSVGNNTSKQNICSNAISVRNGKTTGVILSKKYSQL